MVKLIVNPAMKETDPYLETFERFEAQAKHPPWVFPLPRRASRALPSWGSRLSSRRTGGSRT